MQDNWIKGLGQQSPYMDALKMMGQQGGGMTNLIHRLPPGQAMNIEAMRDAYNSRGGGGQRPMSLGQGENSAPWMHDQNARAMMMAREAMGGGAGMPGTMMNKGAYGGFEDNYFPESRKNMPLAPRAPAIPAVGGNMGMAQGNPDNYFPESRMNSPFGRSPAMAKIGAAPKAQNIAIPTSNRSQTQSPGIRKDGSRIDYSKKSATQLARNEMKNMKRK
jgi:hypothetical protein